MYAILWGFLDLLPNPHVAFETSQRESNKMSHTIQEWDAGGSNLEITNPLTGHSMRRMSNRNQQELLSLPNKQVNYIKINYIIR